MNKFFGILVVLLIFCIPLYARHIRGGEMYYKYEGPGSAPGTSRYSITLKLYIDCQQQSQEQLDASEPITIFKKSNNSQYGGVLTAPLTSSTFIQYDPNSNPCIVNPPTDVCYNLRFYETSVELPDDPDGYILSFQRCCRLDNIVNVIGSGSMGATYECEIPGSNIDPDAPHNSSILVNGNDAVAICAGTPFTFDFSGIDPDGDSLVYHLCDAYLGAGTGMQGNCYSCVSPNPASPPPYTSVPYQGGYSGGSPMGLQVSINSKTGLISGIAPPSNGSGQYVVTACIYEYRKGKLINIHRKDIHLKVSDCNPLRALLKPDYAYCDDFDVVFKNEQNNPPGTVFIWNFGDGSSLDTSLQSNGATSHKYADTGTFKVKLKAILAGQCIDSTTTLAKVYPGFFPSFTVTGSCVLFPLQFNDNTTSRYGFANKWSWDFGDETSTADTSHIKSPSWKYGSIGTKSVTLIVESNKGCIDTLVKDIEVKTKPLVALGFRDTLICSIDTLQLTATGVGNFSWSPNVNIINANTATPLVFPKKTTTYTVVYDENGCTNSDSVKVRVVDDVTLDAGKDSSICLTDAITLQPNGDGLNYTWTPAATLNNASIKNPIATPVATTTVYYVTARIGKCNETDSVTITAIAYPNANAGPDQTICYGDTAQINASVIANTFNWSPISNLLNAQTLNPLAYPKRTTSYILTAFDNRGCPKPGKDTVVITVRPKIFANAGRDTSVVIGQPLQLNGSGAPFYLWQPATGLNKPDINNPIATLTQSITYSMKTYTVEGCFAYDTINIKVFKTNPDIFVPNAFKPGSETNNIFRPIPVGISAINYFRVYNRWGQLVFSSSDATHGWDGTVAGVQQATDTFVWMVQGTDFTGKIVFKKGTVVLIR